MLFDNGLEGSAKELYDKLLTVDFDPASLRRELDSGKYDTEAVNAAAINYVDDCWTVFWDDAPDWDQYHPGDTIPRLLSSHVAETIEILLDYGLDPNRIYKDERDGEVFEEYNIMDQLQCIYNGYQAADSLFLLLSHGGNPNLVVDRQPLISDPDFDLLYDTENRGDLLDAIYDAKLHYWMVLVGFGAILSNGKLPLEPVKGFDLSKLKNHRDYYYGTIYSNRMKEGWDLCIFDRHTNWEVGRV